MEIRRTLQSLVSLVGQGSAPGKPVQPLQALQAGQRLEARVLAQIDIRRLLLEVEGQRVVADTSVPLRPGTRVALEVVNPGGQPQLRVVTSARQSLATNLKVLVPRQIPLAEAMEAMAKLAADAASDKALAGRIAGLLQSLPRLEDLSSADNLAKFLRHSGLFSEASAHHAPPVDLKQQLLQLAGIIRRLHPAPGTAIKGTAPTSPPTGLRKIEKPDPGDDPGVRDLVEQLFRKVAGAVARIALNQMASLPEPESPTLTWHFELPFRQGEHFHNLRLAIQGERTPSSRDAKARPWSVDLEMDLPQLGHIHAKLTYVNGEISTYLWSDRAATRTLFDRHLEQLALRFQKAGLTPKNFQVVETTVTRTPVHYDGPLIDERT